MSAASRLLLLTLLAVLLPAGAASAYLMEPKAVLEPERVAAPLAGEGENLEIIANLEVEGASEIELAGDYAFMDSSSGLHIINIKDPRAPFVESIGECEGSFGDVGVNAPATVAILATDGSGPSCAGVPQGGVAIFDVTNKKAPVFKSYVPVPVGAHTATIDGHLLYINNYDPNYRIIEIYDISNLSEPKKIGTVDMQGTAAHDSYPDHRPDGKVFLYSASVGTHDVIDVTDPTKPMLLQKVRDNQVSISHQLEPNFNRSLLMATDEYGGGAASGVCGKSPTADATYMAGGIVTGAQSVGAMHFYKAAEDGTFSLNGADKVGTFNIPVHGPETSGCTSHVFWQAADQNRLTIGWYKQGTRVVDFSDPAQAKELAWFIPEGGNTWGAKPHRGYVFASDMSRGLDVFRYTGEGGKGWPATSGPAELQRFGSGGYKDVSGAVAQPPARPNPPSASSRKLGRFKVAKRLKRVPGRRGRKTKLTFTVTDKDGVVVLKSRFKKKAGRRVKFRARGVAVVGTYRYVVRKGDRGKVLKRGRVNVKAASGLGLRPDRSLVCRVR